MAENACPFDRVERILLSTDGSECSSGAEREAVRLAQRCSSKLLAMSIIETNVEFSALAPELVEKEEVKVRKILDAVKAQAEPAGVDCETIVHEGESPYQYIIEEADKSDAGIIVIGRRGRSAVKKIVIGSVTARVIGHSNRPVLVAPRAANLDSNKVLLATDGSEFSEAAAARAVAMGKNCGVTPVVISVAGNSSEIGAAEDNISQVKKLAAQSDVAIEGIAVVGQPNEAIVETAIEHDIDLIIIGSHGRTGLKHLLMGSVAERVIDNTRCAVLVARS
jgi:hypothetical protein